jgi:hypothetical protein
MLNKEYYKYCSEILNIKTLYFDVSQLNRTNFQNLFKTKENLIKLKIIFEITCFPNPASPSITA